MNQKEYWNSAAEKRNLQRRSILKSSQNMLTEKI